MPSTSAEDPMALARVLDAAPDDEDYSSDNASGSGEDGEENEDYQEIRDAPSPLHQDTSLYDAIYDAPILELRRLLVQLTDNNADAREKVTSRLLRPAANGRKRKAFDHCENCQKDYATSENSVGACVYHEGMSIASVASILDFKVAEVHIRRSRSR